MKRIAVYSAMTVVLAACGNGGDFDATGTFEATEVLVSAEAAGRILSFDVEEGDTLSAGKQVGAIDTVQLYLQKLHWSVSGLRCIVTVLIFPSKQRL